MALHDNVLGRILTILKQDDYYRTLEELPTIDSLRTYDDIKLFPELYDTIIIIERVTSEADLIERQLQRPGMYPLLKTPIPFTSGFIPRATSTFKPVIPANSQHTADAKNIYQQQSIGSLPGSSLPCGQRTPTASVRNTSTPLQVTIPPNLQHLNSQTPIVLIHHNIVHIPPAYHRLFGNPGNCHHFEQI